MPNVFVICDTGGYLYHFLILELTLLRILRKEENEECIYLHFPHFEKYNQSYMYETIKLLEPEFKLLKDITNYNIINIVEHEPFINLNLNKVSDDALYFLRKQILKKINYKIQKNKYIYITRNGSEDLSHNIRIKRRQILNENDFIEKIKELGFEIINLIKLNFEEKVKLFQTAELIIGPEGSNLTCSLFSNKETNIVSICYNDLNLYHTYHIANSIGLNFNFYNSVKRIHVREDSSGLSDNMEIDIPHFINFVKEIIKNLCESQDYQN